MIANIERGSDFLGCSNYILDDKKDAVIIGGNLSGVKAIEMAEELNAIASQRPEIKKPVWHSSLSAVPGEKLSDKKWNEIAEDYMKGLGFDLLKTPYMIVRHQDKPYEHIHIEASRVAIDRSLYLGRNENLKATKISKKLEKKYGLIRTKGPGYDMLTGKIIRDADLKSTKSLTPGERQMSKRTGEIPPRQHLQGIITAAVKGRPTQAVFETRLTKAGVTFKLSSNGYSYRLDGIPFKGSQLGTAYKWAQLQKSFTTPEEIEMQNIYAARNAAWTLEKVRRDRFRANRSLINSICQLSYSILPQPMSQAVQIAIELLSLVAKVNDWREANFYRDQIKELKSRTNHIKAIRLAEKTKVVQMQVVPVSVVPASPAQSVSVTPAIKTNLPINNLSLTETQKTKSVVPPAPAFTAAELLQIAVLSYNIHKCNEQTQKIRGDEIAKIWAAAGKPARIFIDTETGNTTINGQSITVIVANLNLPPDCCTTTNRRTIK